MTKRKAKKRKKKKTDKVTSPAEQIKVTPYPEAGKKITDFEEKLDEQLAGGELKKGPGRPRKTPEPEPEFAMTENLIAEGIKTPFELWSISQKLDELKLTDKEAAAMALPVKQLLDYYLPNVPLIALAWASLALTTKSVMSPRLILIAEIKKQKAHPPSSKPEVTDNQKGQGGPTPVTPPKQGGKIQFPTNTEPIKL